ncbi:GNAT family N-acetyltransferase [Methylobacterium brachythecii]|uniref:CelD/BcsL family acetyltransferase involved in cellulose biosynthesis n=1 Tax=Methylobacterium brachythecii TaxID=1176177 RepID=A0A7W6F8X6_9HYPH|nr:GNAT family N-acetyltransferase [Methylobacterium brachythecii]MBB3904581.1 CelD/BcsL family acetyltransferase involved in cellulose biosynthesis [Methylobacterium brachythecii]GLS46356.1 hypothetical protein GCM10007884_43500 [Methylobacterium brachythecii]
MIALAPTAEAASAAPAARRAATYVVETSSDWSAVSAGWTGAGTPFQESAWLGAWYEALGARAGLTPLLVTARDAASGEVAVRLPLVLLREGRRRTIGFADLDLTDYNAPALGPAAPRDAQGAAALWKAIRKALPRADLVRFAKMPLTLRGRPNPLALLPNIQPCALNGNVVVTGEDWDGWRRGLEKTVRKELERSWRVFSREPETSFEIVTDPERARRIVDAMEHQQETRMREKGASYVLDDPDFARFYRTLIERSIEGGEVLVSALMAGDEVVASLLGIRDGETYVMIRISNAAGRWSNCSPGRLIIERTMAALHAEGYRSFDFSIGNYDYKRRFGVTPTPLVDFTESLGLAGIPATLRAAAAGGLRRYPELDRKLRGWIGRLRATKITS